MTSLLPLLPPHVSDEGQIVCQDPPDMMGQRLSDVGMQLRTDCHQTLGYWDYLFFIAIGFVIFSTGTVVAWVMGVFMVLYERYSKLRSEKLDREAEERLRQVYRANVQGNGDLKKAGLHV